MFSVPLSVCNLASQVGLILFREVRIRHVRVAGKEYLQSVNDSMMIVYDDWHCVQRIAAFFEWRAVGVQVTRGIVNRLYCSM